MNIDLGLLPVFLAGMFSFVSPCVLPLLPIYLATILGGRGGVLVNSLLFCAGFLVVFITMGATASLLGSWLWDYQDIIRKIGAAVVVLMGIMMLDIVRINRLNKEFRPFFNKSFAGPVGSFLAGMAFTLGWTPCNGPILAAVLGYAAIQATVASGVKLLTVYSLGFIIPFLLVAVFFRQLERLLQLGYQYLPIIRRIAGILLIVAGALLYMNKLPTFI